MAGENGNESVLAWAAATVAKSVKNVGKAFKEDMTHGSGPAIAREAVNDLRGSLHQVFFGQNESHQEPGTPMAPLQSEIAARKKVGNAPVKGDDAKALYGKGGKAMHGQASRLPSPSEIAAETRPYQPKPEQYHGQHQGNSR